MRNEDVVCDVCGTCLYDEATKSSLTAFHVSLKDTREDKSTPLHKEITRLYETLGKDEYHICYVCWVRSMGVVPK